MIKSQSIICSLLLMLFVYTSSAQEAVSRQLTIKELFTLAEENNLQLQVSRTGIEIAGQRTEVAKTQRRPNLTADLSASYIGDAEILNTNFSEIEKVPMPHFGNSFSVQASQVVFKGGYVNNTIERAALDEQIARLSFDRTRADIKLMLVAQYVDLYRFLRQRDVYLNNIELAQIRLKNIKKMYEQGMITRNDVLRSELQLSNLNTASQEASNNFAIANQQLCIMAGLPTNTLLIPDSTFLQTKMEDHDYDTYLNIALRNFPDIKTAQVNTEIAKKNLQIVKTDRIPTLRLQAGNSLARPITSASPALDLYSNGWNVGLGISYNISSLYNARHNIALASKQLQQQQEEANMQEQAIEIDVNTAFIKHNEAKEKAQSFEQGVQLANENYRIVEKKYYATLSLITDVLDATNAKLDAELQLTNAQANIVYTYYQLQRLAGNL